MRIDQKMMRCCTTSMVKEVVYMEDEELRVSMKNSHAAARIQETRGMTQ